MFLYCVVKLFLVFLSFHYVQNAFLISCMALRFAEIISVDVIPYKGGNLLLNALRKFGFFPNTS